MARFSKFFFGGIVGAGLALLFTPRKGSDVRRMLMSRRQPAYLPSPEEAPPVDLEARIEETRRQVESQLEQPFAEEAVTTEVPEEAAEETIEEPGAGLEEAPAAEGGEAAGLEAEMTVSEPVETGTVTPGVPPEPVEDVEEVPEAAEVTGEVEAEVPGAAAPEPLEEPFEEPVEETVGEIVEEEVSEAGAPAMEAEAGEAVEAAAEEADEWSSLGTPAEGEPTIGEPPAAAGEAAGGTAAGEAGAMPGQADTAAFDREAMRRRIEETRARLKAKAFDAMVQGETFIDAGSEADDEGAGFELDAESEEAIEETLREED